MPNSYVVHFLYHLGDKVTILDAGCGGVVTGVMVGGAAMAQEFRVVYWHAGERKIEWVYPHEIRAAGTKRVGVWTEGATNAE